MATEKQENIVLTTKKVDQIIHNENMGIKLKKHEKLWFTNIKGVRKANIPFALDDEEMKEYLKCKMSVHYFAQKYCQIKREDGSIGPMVLRDYQKDIIDLYTQNRFSILMASRQTGKCNSFSTSVLILDEETKDIFSVPFYELYYDVVRQERKLTFLEKMKIFLYRIYMKIDK
jgi:hypothetical protein